MRFSISIIFVAMLNLIYTTMEATEPILGIPQKIDGLWMMRINHPDNEEVFSMSMNAEGFVTRTTGAEGRRVSPSVSFHRLLDKPVSAVAFRHRTNAADADSRLVLYDAAANELWRSGDQSDQDVKLNGLELHGQLIFRIEHENRNPPDGQEHHVTSLTLENGIPAPVVGKDGFKVIDSLAALRGYASKDGVKVRMRPGVYPLDKALYHHFVEFTGNGSHFDLTGVRIQANTDLFSQFGIIPGEGGFYTVITIAGNHTILEGAFIETYGSRPGLQSRNKIINIIGNGVLLRDVTVRTEGSQPWGHGSLFGISGGIVRKMNGIRVGAPAQNVRLEGCRVRMRAMGHAIFVQGAVDTVIKDCHVDGLLRPTNDILAETSGIAYERDFRIQGNGEGVTPKPDNRIPPYEMVSLSEDGIRLYTRGGNIRTGATTIIDSTVTGMRRGICTAFGGEANRIVNSTVTDCIAAGFHVGTDDVVINGRADSKYSEALTIPNNNSRRAKVELRILDSRNNMGNNLLAKINGTEHEVLLTTEKPESIPKEMVVELGSDRGYLGRDDYGDHRAEGVASRVTVENRTPARLLLTERVVDSTVTSHGPIENSGGNSNHVTTR